MKIDTLSPQLGTVTPLVSSQTEKTDTLHTYILRLVSSMMFYLKASALLMVTCVVVSIMTVSSKSLGQQEKVFYPSQLDMVDDDGSLDNALLNYLFARQMVNRLRNNMDVTDLQRKRSYWKQCAFNAVSCFGKK
ncbi:prohormone-1 [Nephila pilipes]|uniref:Prohormone-1 n=1 Tax=Nephila pilipes TaxID=299642 RepID=A0A8X6N0I1_NEPPI|nr:prohormone-1 [Nephila pilipes]